ncbi:MAG: GHKL domain-containing protein [Chitinispirillaceae bacterium]|nr:GHKL domain-containing protein [Chitinispirillaceae bacterium]
MKIIKSKITIPLVTSLVIYIIIFVADLLTPLGHSHWIFYILPLLVVYLTENTVLIYLMLAISVPALIIGYVQSPMLPVYENIRNISLFNRTAGFFVLSVFTIIISKLIQARKHYRVQASDLAYANKELESFSYSTAHDLKSPLQAIKGFSQILIEDYGNKLDQQAIDFLKRISISSDRMTSTINDMLSLSKISLEEMNIQKVNISELAESIFAELRTSAPERNVDVNINKGMEAKADSHLIRIALVNLIGNAWKYTSKKERATISVESKTTREEFIFIIKDNGCGFDMKLAGKLFLPFKRLHSEADFEGTGIGLSIVDRVIKRHRGRVWAESQINKGTSFYFTLPLRR